MSAPVRWLPSRLCPLVIAGFVLAIGLTAVPATAQILYGSIVGAVRDSTGAVLPGATVTVVNKETNLTREAITNVAGAYSIINVQPGPYDIKITLTNLGLSVRPDLVDGHTIHWHGFRNAIPLFDGVPELSIAVPIGPTGGPASSPDKTRLSGARRSPS